MRPGATASKTAAATGIARAPGYGPRIMKLSDHESDTMAAARLAPPPPNTPLAYRESWLDKLARHLGAAPVDHVVIPPVSFAPARTCDASAGVSCSG